MHFCGVSTLVNNPTNDLPECIEPLQEDGPAEAAQAAMAFPQNGVD